MGEIITETKEIRVELQRMVQRSGDAPEISETFWDGVFAEALLTLVVRMESLELSLGLKGEEEPREL